MKIKYSIRKINKLLLNGKLTIVKPTEEEWNRIKADLKSLGYISYYIDETLDDGKCHWVKNNSYTFDDNKKVLAGTSDPDVWGDPYKSFKRVTAKELYW